jgi:DNA-directed RNA polymerase specialized sigma24 family protein
MVMTPKKVHVTLQRRGQHWIAQADDPLGSSVSGRNTRAARRLILASLAERHGEVEVEFEIALSSTQAAAVQAYRQAEEQLRQLTKQVPKSRLQCAETLLGLNLSQGEVADLLGMSRGHLAVMLKRAEGARASTRRPPRKPV